MAASQLSIYNEALMLCEERILATIAENRKPRRDLDEVWNNGGVNSCLEEGLWTFAARSTAAQYDPDILPSFGYMHAFKRPDDFIRTAAVSADPYFNNPLTQYSDEAGYWWSDQQVIYVKYISSNENYGNNLTLWPESFKQFVAAHFASKVVKTITHDKSIQDRVELARKTRLISARGKDAMNEPAKFFPRGQLTSARRGNSSGRLDRNGGRGCF